MDNSNETDVHAMVTKALVEALPEIKHIIKTGSGTVKVDAVKLLKEIYEARHTESVADELTKLHNLRNTEVLTDEEFNKQKIKLLG